MGFTRKQAEDALIKSGYDEEKALDALLAGWKTLIMKIITSNLKILKRSKH